MSDGEPERLQKVLARLGLASRREAEEWIRAGRLVVNGAIASLGTRVGPADQVRLDGRPLRVRAPRAQDARDVEVFLCHRSPGEPLRDAPATPAPTHEDDAAHGESRDDGMVARAPLLDRLPRRGGRRYIAISPMPRVDGGLEVVTADGGLAETLQRAVRGLRTDFTVRIRGELTEQQVAGLMGGELDRGERLAVEAVEPGGGEGANRWYTLVTRGASGKDVRQLFERQGALVSRILRTRLGPLVLDRGLARSHFRRVERGELEQLHAAIGTPPAAAPAADAHGGRGDRDRRRDGGERAAGRGGPGPARDAEPTGRGAGRAKAEGAPASRAGGSRPDRRAGAGGPARGPQRPASRRVRDRGRGSGPRPSGRR